MVHPIWFEQMTFAESKRCSTAELRVHELALLVGLEPTATWLTAMLPYRQGPKRMKLG
jgi:hypothetical protein